MPDLRFEDSKIKIIAFYLPQYHSIPENDKAWGEGFTEWTNVKKAEPLFSTHYQPRIPLNKNYYNLLDDKTAIWQANLAKAYGVYGFCYYHYWFKDGKKLLERPAEKMLNNKDVDLPFCFCWANENWTRRWDGGNNEIIVEQDYGDEEDWEKHFQYLLQFFKDKRYILMDNSPLLIIYKPEQIESINAMVLYLKKRCKEEGFSDCTVIFQFPNVVFNNKVRAKRMGCSDKSLNDYIYDYYIAFEPLFSMMERSVKEGYSFRRIARGIGRRLISSFHFNAKSLPQKLDYDATWQQIINRPFFNKHMLVGAFVDWDNTPRNRNGVTFLNSSPEKFGNYMTNLVKKVENSYLENIIFITAWNEWGEGSYLEPDERYGYAYLDALKKAINVSK